ncbi:AP2-ERF domain [Babesia duncani]|uniref:AP2-ERF domain n=1 Tax=Babesia duncani TaxID=323732 RepID=A0AAD9PIL2_9APIC|nr:AP2-ERF domain [Babesia duncani]
MIESEGVALQSASNVDLNATKSSGPMNHCNPPDPINHSTGTEDLKDKPKQTETVYHTCNESEFLSIASIETQPALYYNQTPLYPGVDYSYDPEKTGAYPSACYGYNYGINYTDYKQANASTQHTNGAGKEHINQHDQTTVPNDQQNKNEIPTNPEQPLYPLKQKVVAVNPVILVDKVERSLIVQWYENNIRREQRISYKKYGNAKAQQRAENLINKLLSGSTFDQLYPEKGPPVLTIFENVGEYMVTLTRDRIAREWRVDWVNSNGMKMRARWSCKKVGNEEAKKRADTFANSLIQGTFNPRLLHKATGTRLSRNDMKYNAVLNSIDSINSTTKKALAIDETDDSVPQKRTTLRRTRSDIGKRRNSKQATSVNSMRSYKTMPMYHNNTSMYNMYDEDGTLINIAALQAPIQQQSIAQSDTCATVTDSQYQNWCGWNMNAGMGDWDYYMNREVYPMVYPQYMPTMDMMTTMEQNANDGTFANVYPCYTETKMDPGMGYYDMGAKVNGATYHNWQEKTTTPAEETTFATENTTSETQIQHQGQMWNSFKHEHGDEHMYKEQEQLTARDEHCQMMQPNVLQHHQLVYPDSARYYDGTMPYN